MRRYGFDLAAVVSASHNPYQDNGIKFFGPEGMKLGDDQEAEIESRLGGAERATSAGCASCTARRATTCASSSCASPTSTSSGVRVLLDCANGATYRVAPEIFRRLGADVDAIAAEPDGRNINDGLRLHAHRGAGRAHRTATTSASRSTATATACSRSTATGRSWTATS